MISPIKLFQLFLAVSINISDYDDDDDNDDDNGDARTNISRHWRTYTATRADSSCNGNRMPAEMRHWTAHSRRGKANR